MKRKTFWLGNCDQAVDIFDKKPKKWHKTTKCWEEEEFDFYTRKDARRYFRGTGLKLPRKNSKQLIPFHIVPAKGVK